MGAEWESEGERERVRSGVTMAGVDSLAASRSCKRLLGVKVTPVGVTVTLDDRSLAKEVEGVMNPRASADLVEDSPD